MAQPDDFSSTLGLERILKLFTFMIFFVAQFWVICVMCDLPPLQQHHRIEERK
jgi:hypothetical protein